MADNHSNHQAPPRHLVITVGRQFGSGGRELGRKIADLLGIDYYDKELLSKAASDAGVAESFVRENDERAPKFLSSAISFNMGISPVAWYQGPSSISGDSIYGAQGDVIRKLALEKPCVIVGRTADYILRDFPCVVNIFVHAPIESCIDRICRRSPSMTRQKARQLAEKTNKLRASYYNFYTDKRWGDTLSYDLTIDTSMLSTDDIAAIVADYAKRRLEKIRNPDG